MRRIQLERRIYRNDNESYVTYPYIWIPDQLYLLHYEAKQNETIDESEYLNELIHKFSSSVERPLKNDKPIYRGKTEPYFLNFIYEHFFRSCEIKVNYCLRGYIPDIAIILKNGLIIDVEIDEPYTLYENKPIHHIGDIKGFERDSLFIKANWIIIRFAELQILQNPKGCIKEIGLIMRKFGHKVHPIVYEYPDLTHFQRWTIKDATKMAEDRVRENYLNQYMQLNLL